MNFVTRILTNLLERALSYLKYDEPTIPVSFTPTSPTPDSPVVSEDALSSTTDSPSDIFGLNPQEVFRVAAEIPVQDWDSIVFCGMSKTKDPGSFQIFRLVWGDPEEVNVCAQIAVRLVTIHNATSKFSHDVDHTKQSKH